MSDRTEIYEINAPKMSDNEREKLERQLIENQQEKAEMHVYLEGCKRNIEFLNRFQSKVRNLFQKEGVTLNKAMKSFLDQSDESDKERKRIMKRLGMKKVSKITASKIQMT